MAQKNELAKIKQETVDAVTSRVKALEARGEIEFPPDYSPQNALRSAWLILQETVDRNKQPVLQACSQVSIMNSMLDMVVQGLNPAKKQCYFIAYGKQLTCMRSYHGTMALAKRVDPDIADIVAEVVWEGDEFEFVIEKGQKRVVTHKQTFSSIDSNKPVGAYCQIIGHDGEVRKTEVMTWNQIKSSWKKSIMKPIDDKGNVKGGGTHGDFMADMIRRTVINKACKPIINASSDAHLKVAAERSEYVQVEHEAGEAEAAEANGDFVDITPDPPEEEPDHAPPEDAQQPEGGAPGQEQYRQPATMGAEPDW